MKSRSMNRRGFSHSAPYGQACMPCFKSKCRCIARPEGGGCERCYRLYKQCHPADSLRRRNGRGNQNSDARLAQLEGRLDSLASGLRSIVGSPDLPADLRKVVSEDGVAGHEQPQQQSADTGAPVATRISSLSTAADCNPCINTNEGAAQTSTAGSPPTMLPCSLCIDDSSSACPLPCEPPAAEAEAYLGVFRSRMLRHFAFIHIPPDLTAQQLRRDRPFLFHAIVAVTSPSTQQKQAWGRKLKHILAQAALLENQSSIDLLLGLLTFVAWSYDHFLSGSGTLSRLMMLSVSLVYDLRLNKPLPPDAHVIAPLTTDFEASCRDPRKEMDQHFLEPLERQRAVLGCYFLSSIVSTYFAQMDAMRWTHQMEEDLRAVAANKDCPADEALAFQVRLQLLAQRAVRMRDQRQVEFAQQATGVAAPLPAFLHLKVLQGQLQELKRSLSPALHHQEILLAHVHYIELCINEATHTANSDTPSLVRPADSSSNNLSGFERLECLWWSANAIKSWLEIFFTLPPSACLGFSFLFWAQLARCLVILYRLTTLEDPAWDRRAVRNTVDLLPVLDQVADKLELAGSEAGERSSDDMFMQLTRMTRNFRAWFGAKTAGEGSGEEPAWFYAGTATGVRRNAADRNHNQHHMMRSIDFGNDMWLEEIFGLR